MSDPSSNSLPVYSNIPLFHQQSFPLSTLLYNWSKNTHDRFHELIEDLESQRLDDRIKRRKIFDFCISKQRQL